MKSFNKMKNFKSMATVGIFAALFALGSEASSKFEGNQFGASFGSTGINSVAPATEVDGVAEIVKNLSSHGATSRYASFISLSYQYGFEAEGFILAPGLALYVLFDNFKDEKERKASFRADSASNFGVKPYLALGYNFFDAAALTFKVGGDWRSVAKRVTVEGTADTPSVEKALTNSFNLFYGGELTIPLEKGLSLKFSYEVTNVGISKDGESVLNIDSEKKARIKSISSSVGLAYNL
jgi:hypothetical protein